MFFTLRKPKNIDELKKISVKFVGIDRSKVKILIIDDELVEITPKSIRLRKVHLKEVDRKRVKNPVIKVY